MPLSMVPFELVEKQVYLEKVPKCADAGSIPPSTKAVRHQAVTCR